MKNRITKKFTKAIHRDPYNVCPAHWKHIAKSFRKALSKLKPYEQFAIAVAFRAAIGLQKWDMCFGILFKHLGINLSIEKFARPIPSYIAGGVVPGGIAIVGERGREVIKNPFGKEATIDAPNWPDRRILYGYDEKPIQQVEFTPQMRMDMKDNWKQIAKLIQST